MNLDFTSLLSEPGERLRSIKNEVVRIQTPLGAVVRKRYRFALSYKNEVAQLRNLLSHGLHVPGILFHQPNTAFLEDLGDITYVDVLDMFHDEVAFDKPMRALLDFLSAYYKAAHILRGDVNLRNFLYKDGSCYGVDFEDLQPDGPRESDLGRILAFILTYVPAFDPNRTAAAHMLWKNCLLQGYTPALLRQYMQAEFEAMNVRRKGFKPLYEKALAFAPGWEGWDA